MAGEIMTDATAIKVSLGGIYIASRNQAFGDVWIDLDSASGGYPYLTSFKRAHDFGTVEEAARYLKMFRKDYPEALILDVRSAEITVTDKTAYLAEREAYDAELQALHDKYAKLSA